MMKAILTKEEYGPNDNPVFYVESLQEKITELEQKLLESEKKFKDERNAFIELRATNWENVKGMNEKLKIATEALEKIAACYNGGGTAGDALEKIKGKG